MSLFEVYLYGIGCRCLGISEAHSAHDPMNAMARMKPRPVHAPNPETNQDTYKDNSPRAQICNLKSQI